MNRPEFTSIGIGVALFGLALDAVPVGDGGLFPGAGSGGAAPGVKAAALRTAAGAVMVERPSTSAERPSRVPGLAVPYHYYLVGSEEQAEAVRESVAQKAYQQFIAEIAVIDGDEHLRQHLARIDELNAAHAGEDLPAVVVFDLR